MPAIISKNANTKGSGLTLGTPYDSGNILGHVQPGGFGAKLVNSAQPSATTRACDATAGQPGNYLEGSNQNEEGSGYISVTALSYNSGTGVLTVTVANKFSVGQNVQFNGFAAGGININRVNAVILTCSTSQFTCKVGTGLTISTDTGKVIYTNFSQSSGLSLGRE